MSVRSHRKSKRGDPCMFFPPFSSMIAASVRREPMSTLTVLCNARSQSALADGRAGWSASGVKGWIVMARKLPQARARAGRPGRLDGGNHQASRSDQHFRGQSRADGSSSEPSLDLIATAASPRTSKPQLKAPSRGSTSPIRRLIRNLERLDFKNNHFDWFLRHLRSLHEGLDDRFQETAQSLSWPFIHGMRPFRASQMI